MSKLGFFTSLSDFMRAVDSELWLFALDDRGLVARKVLASFAATF